MLLHCAILFLCAVNCLAKLPSDVPRCKPRDLDCVVRAANKVVRQFPNGRPEEGIPAIDPFVIYNVTIDEQPEAPINLKLFLKKAEIRGLSNGKYEKAVGWSDNFKKSKFELYGTIPRLELDGQYIADGKILYLPIQGDGLFQIILENVQAGIKFKPNVIEKDGNQYLKLINVKIILEPSNMRVKLTNLFNGNKELGKVINDILNKNWQEAWTEVAPTIMRVAESFIKDTLTQFLDHNDVNDFYLS